MAAGRLQSAGHPHHRAGLSSLDPNVRRAARARATIGIAMGGAGTDVALETADVALMADDLSRLPFAIALSRAAHSIVQQNLWAAFGVVALLIPATLVGLASMGIAVLIHEGSTVLVVLNALRLLRFVDTADPQLTQLNDGALMHGPQQA